MDNNRKSDIQNMKLIGFIISLSFFIIIGLSLLFSVPNDESINNEENNVEKDVIEEIAWDYLLIPIAIIVVFGILVVIRFYNNLGIN